MTILYADGATTRVCFAFEDEEPVVVPLDKKVTSNVAEYLALITGLEAAIKRGLKGITVRSDSQLVVNQINTRMGRLIAEKGEIGYVTKKRRLYNLGTLAIAYIKEAEATLEWVPRKQNLAGIRLERKED